MYKCTCTCGHSLCFPLTNWNTFTGQIKLLAFIVRCFFYLFIDVYSWKTFSVFFGQWYLCELFTLLALHDHSLFKRYGFKRFRIWSLSACGVPQYFLILVHLVFKPLFSLSGHECRCGAVVWSSYLIQVNKQSCFKHTLAYSNGVLKMKVHWSAFLGN